MVQIVQADLHNKKHGADYVRLLNDYAGCEMGGGTNLTMNVQTNLVAEIKLRDFITIFLAYDSDIAIALLTCLEGFSTFQCRPLLNIHDVYVDEKYRGQGISTKLLQATEHLAKCKSCCKLTLEVLQGNRVAKKAYENFGFKAYNLDPEIGEALFWEKKLG